MNNASEIGDSETAAKPCDSLAEDDQVDDTVDCGEIGESDETGGGE